jgi:hypothetical protein
MLMNLPSGHAGQLRKNNFSLSSADRLTHLKVVAVALVSASLIIGLAAASRISHSLTATVMKAGKPVTASTSERSAVSASFTLPGAPCV